MKVKKRDGALKPLDIKQIRKQTKPACEGLKDVSYEELELSAQINFKDGMKTADIQTSLKKTAIAKIDIDRPDWAFVAGRLELYNLYHKIKHSYLQEKVSGNVYDLVTIKDVIQKYGHLYNLDENDLDKFDMSEINNYIKPEKDLYFNHLAVDTLIERYLISDHGVLIELPQHLFMLTAMTLAKKEQDVMKWVKKFYDVMSELEYLPATPTLSNARKKGGNCFSCAVGSTPDNIEAIFETYKTQALGSKAGTGWGWDWTRIRANGGIIQNKPGAAGGLVPWMKLENDVAIAVDQLGTRLGAINVTIESWHKDMLDFLDLKKDGGEDKRRAKELFISISCSDEFMYRIDNNLDWVLFDPYDTRELTELHGTEFVEKYKEYEYKFYSDPNVFTNKPIVMKAKDLWKRIQRTAYEAGNPFIFFKDHVNKEFYKFKEEGIVRSGNLCMEYLTPIEDDEVTVCNLGSINIARVNKDDDMQRVIPIAMRMLDNVIDITTYAIPKSEEVQKRRRSVGLGVAGEGEHMANSNIHYGSVEHLEWIEDFYSKFEKYSDQASIELGEERGVWKSGEIFRNFVRRCIAPTSSISIIMGTTPAHEAVFDTVWVEENAMGAFKVTAPNINVDNIEFYVSIYDVDQLDFIKTTAIRQKYIDMGISHTMYFRPETTTGKVVFDAYMLAWKLGLKTIYYIRSKSKELIEEARDREGEIACFGCGG